MNAAASLEVRVPDMGNFKDVAVIDVLVKPGDTIDVDTPLLTLESDKATMDVPSTAAGVVEKLHTSKGGKVNTGDLVVTLRGTGAQSATAAAAEPAPPQPAPGEPSGAARSGAPASSAAQPGETPPSGTRSSPAAARPASGDGSASPPSGASAGGRMMPRSALGTPTSYRSDLAPIDEPGFSRAHAGPSVRKFARELGVDLALVSGHGFKDRITHDDVKVFVKGSLAGGEGTAVAGGGAAAAGAGGTAVSAGGAPRAMGASSTPAAAGSPAPAPSRPAETVRTALPAVAAVDFSQFGETTLEPLSRIQRISGPRLHASWVNIPHVTQFDEADITELERLRASLKDRAEAAGVKLTPLAFIMRACVRALQEFPRFNSALDPDGANLIVRKYIHMGFAADTAQGLVVPVVRDADRKDVYALARALSQLSEKARAGKLPITDMQGGCFTISSLGGIGGTAFTPIINAPEVAILGVSRSALRPVYRDGAFVPRLMLPLSLSYDHRVIDGAMAARFTTWLSQTLADPRNLVEAVP
jgi:pyruvate dehydrogenase E2 component (dihydrolipoamide acetyltransferase)